MPSDSTSTPSIFTIVFSGAVTTMRSSRFSTANQRGSFRIAPFGSSTNALPDAHGSVTAAAPRINVAVVVQGTVAGDVGPRGGPRRRNPRTKVTIFEARTGTEVACRIFDGPAPAADAIDAWLAEQ